MAEAFKKSDIEILVATMHRNSLDFLKQMFPAGYNKLSILVINQTTEDSLLVSDQSLVRVINSFEHGLSKSRNTALKNAIGKLCVIADDDIVFTDGFDDAIVHAFNDNPDAALISFRTEKSPGKLFKKYPSGRKVTLSRFDHFNIMSIEMVLNRDVIIDANIQFDERFGLGSKFGMGEEAILINDISREKLKMVMEPVVMNRHAANSTHTTIHYTKKYFILGAVYTAIFRSRYILWLLLKTAFDIKHSQIAPLHVPAAIRAALAGRKAFIQTQ